MNDDLTLLASTYLDGEATPDERARVEADPALLAEVERLRAARATLLDTRWFERPSDDVREAAIAAALTAWDASASGLTDSATGSRRTVRRSHVTSFERRRTYTRLLSAAAAVVAVVAFGVVVAQFDSGGGDDQSAATETEAPADTQTRAAAAAELTEQIAPPDETTSAVFSGDVAADDAGGADQDTSAAPEAPAATESAAGSALVSEASITTPDELGAFAAAAKAAFDDGAGDANRDVLAAPCAGEAFDDIDEYLATVTYRNRVVMVGIDNDRQLASAVDPDTCEIVAEAPLP